MKSITLFFAIATLCTPLSATPVRELSVVGHLLVSYYNSLYQMDIQQPSPASEATAATLGAKGHIAMQLDAEFNFDDALRSQLPSPDDMQPGPESLVSQEQAFILQLLSGNASGEALAWLDSKIFSNLSPQEIVAASAGQLQQEAQEIVQIMDSISLD